MQTRPSDFLSVREAENRFVAPTPNLSALSPPTNLLREKPKKEFLATFLLASRPLLLAVALAWAMGSPSCGLEGSCRAAVTAPRTSASIIGPAIAQKKPQDDF